MRLRGGHTGCALGLAPVCVRVEGERGLTATSANPSCEKARSCSPHHSLAAPPQEAGKGTWGGAGRGRREEHRGGPSVASCASQMGASQERAGVAFLRPLLEVVAPDGSSWDPHGHRHHARCWRGGYSPAGCGGSRARLSDGGPGVPGGTAPESQGPGRVPLLGSGRLHSN